MKLFRVSIKKDCVFAKGEAKPFYVIETSKEKAKIYMNSVLKKGFSVSGVTYLGDAVSNHMFTKSN